MHEPYDHDPACFDAEALLDLYVDGELPFACEGELFSHLATCEDCRRQFDALLHFRMILRDERLEVPPAVDEAFFKKLAQHKKALRRYDRRADRLPLWNLRTRVSLRAAVVSMACFFVLGWWFTQEPKAQEAAAPMPVATSPASKSITPPADDNVANKDAIFVIFPGITVEEERDPSPPPEP